MKTNDCSFKKRDYELAVKKSISMPGILLDMAMDKTRQKGFSTFSDYIQDLVRRDNLNNANAATT